MLVAINHQYLSFFKLEDNLIFGLDTILIFGHSIYEYNRHNNNKLSIHLYLVGTLGTYYI